MRSDCGYLFARLPPAATNIARERSFFDPAMNSRLFESFEGGGLGVRQPRFRAAFGEGPSPGAVAAGPHQQELDIPPAHPVANRGDLLTLPQVAQL